MYHHQTQAATKLSYQERLNERHLPYTRISDGLFISLSVSKKSYIHCLATLPEFKKFMTPTTRPVLGLC
jgi:hypothetical protein